MASHREYYKGGRWWFPSNLGHGEYACGESCESVYARGESYDSVYARGESIHQNCSNHALTNLLFGLCRSM
jgi:hypothetical protein